MQGKSRIGKQTAYHEEASLMTRSILSVSSALSLLVVAACSEPLPTQPDAGEGAAEAPSLAVASNSWTAKPAIPGSNQRIGLIAASGYNDAGESIVYVLGGYAGEQDATSILAYNVTTNTWSTKSAVFRRSFSNGSAVIGGKVYIPGGYNFSSGAGFCCDSYRNTLWVYDPKRDIVYLKAPMPTATADGVSGVINGKLYVVAGSEPGGSRAGRLDRYDPASNSWTNLAPSPHSHFRGMAGVIGGKLYVVGGLDELANPTTQLDVYDPATNAWKTLAALPNGRYRGGAVVLHDRLYVVGENGGNRTTYVYDPATNTWSSKASFPAGQYSPYGAVQVKLGGVYRLLTVGGVRVSDGGNAPSQLYTR
jgi:N-acetylneuraminic acid mutarotase